MREIVKLTLGLALFAAISAALLAFCNEKTKSTIEKQAETKRLALSQKLLHLEDGEELENCDTQGHFVCYAVKDGVRTKVVTDAKSPNGYGGEITIMVSADREGNILDFAAFKHSETPGLGAKIQGEDFAAKICVQKVTSNWRVKKDGGDVDGITSATISSRAVCEAIASVRDILNFGESK